MRCALAWPAQVFLPYEWRRYSPPPTIQLRYAGQRVTNSQRATRTYRLGQPSEQLFDHVGDAPRSAQSFGYGERGTDRLPDHLDILAVGQCLLHGPPAKASENEILGHALGVRAAEVLIHPLPELGKPHGGKAT